MNYADELGLLYFEEPGGFRLDVKQPFMNAVLHEKVIRMVKRIAVIPVWLSTI